MNAEVDNKLKIRPRAQCVTKLQTRHLRGNQQSDEADAEPQGSATTAGSPGCYRYFFSGVIGVTGCDPPVDFGPGVTPALFSSFCVAVSELPAAVEPIFGVAPEVGPLPASLVDTAPLVGPLPASIFDCANAGAETPIATAAASK
jgi:hypothetical protein